MIKRSNLWGKAQICLIFISPLLVIDHFMRFTAQPVLAQSCQEVNSGISRISSEIKAMQAEEVGDNSAPRATMRAARMTFGAQAQANLINYGKSMGCKFSGLKLPTSISTGSEQTGAGGL